MDEIVKQAMAKWPNVPHCYGWLGLDARGVWRMRDERAQQLQLAGDPLRHPALLAFINRNYTADQRGCWYFQNGPQRVYVNLAVAPYIARTDPAQGLLLQTGEALSVVEQVWMTDRGALLLAGQGKLAQLDDRDVAHVLEQASLTDDALLAWLGGAAGALTLPLLGLRHTVQRIAQDEVAARFQFVTLPQP